MASHDGYAPRFGLYHERELTLSEGGVVLAGRDRFMRAGGAAPRDNGRDLVSVRFHLHPEIELSREGPDRLVLAAPQAHRWALSCRQVEPGIEESIYFAGLAGPRRSRQIVLSFKASEIPEIRWQLSRLSPSGEPPRG